MGTKIKYNEYSFIVPCNDGESKKIVEICQSLKLDVRISRQKWGAVLEKEHGETFKNLKANVVIIEMPGIGKEKQLIEDGHSLEIIDHHVYKLGQTLLDRRNKKSSLEQLAELIGYTLNRFEMGIALNDRGYIWLLRKEGYSQREIEEIRQYDLMAQGYTKEEFEASAYDYKKGEMIPEKNLFIVKTKLTNTSYIADIHQFKTVSTQDLLILHNGNNTITEINFYGAPERCKKLFPKFGGWLGGDESISMFWGCNKKVLDEKEILGEL